MNNGQLKPGYNVHIAVESEYIVGVGLFHNPTDTTTPIPFMERIQSNSKMPIFFLRSIPPISPGDAWKSKCYRSLSVSSSISTVSWFVKHKAHLAGFASRYSIKNERCELREVFDAYMRFGGMPGIADFGRPLCSLVVVGRSLLF